MSILGGIIRNKAIESNGFWEAISLKKENERKKKQNKKLRISESTKIEKKKSVKEAAIAKHNAQYFAHIPEIARLGFGYLFYFIVISVTRGRILTKFRIWNDYYRQAF